MYLSTRPDGRAVVRAALRLTLLVALGWTTSASAATITVDTSDDGRNNNGDCSLREAVIAANTDAAVDGCAAGSGPDDIVFAPTVIAPVVLGQMGYTVTTPIAIDGTLATGRVTIDGSLLYQIFWVESGGMLRLSNADLTRGMATRGGAIYVASGGAIDVQSVGFDANMATGDAPTDGGGAIFAEGDILDLSDATFTDNVATGTSGSGGALFVLGGDAAITNTTFTGNRANRAGGAIENRDGTLLLDGVDFASNDAGTNPGNGGAIHLSAAGSAEISGGTVQSNTAVEGGGFWNSGATMMVTGTAFTGNVATGDGAPDNIQGGGALYNEGGLLAVVDVTAIGNVATGASGSGGGLLNNGGTVWVMTSTFTGNLARRAGGAVEDAGGTVILAMNTMENNSVVADANPGNGGAVHSGGGTVVVAGGTYRGNAAVEGGGLWTSGLLVVTADERDIPDAMNPGVVIPTITPALITDNEATGNDADQGGGGLYATPSGAIQIYDANVTENVASGASGSGGGIFSAGALTAIGTTIANNTANRAGGGIEDAGGTVALTDVVLVSNRIGTPAPGNGGGLHSGGGDVTIVRSLVADNAAVEGGGIWVNGALTINGGARGDRGNDEKAAEGDRSFFTVVARNDASGADAGIGGGGIYLETGATASVRYAVLDENTASGAAGSGGGLFLADGTTAEVAFSEIVNNRANRAGGGVELFDDAATGAATSLALRQVLVADNAIGMAPAPGNGGGLHAGGAGTVVASMSTFAGNAAVEGGGLWINAAGSLTLENSTVSGNTSQTDGGGVYDNGGAAIALSSATVAGNSADNDGGGLFSASTDAFSLRNTIVGDNTAGGSGPDCSGTVQSGAFNMVEDASGCTLTGGDPTTDIVGADPVLEPLAYNGGFTPTRALMVWSRAINTGDSQFDVDQRGFQRRFTQDDRGAFEFEGAQVATGDDVAPGTLGLGTPQPNPTAGAARVTFSVASAGTVELALFNVLGQRVLTVFDGTASPSAAQTVDLDVRGLAAGVYVLRLQAGGATQTRQLTVVR